MRFYLFLLLCISYQSFAQTKVIRKVNDQEYELIQKMMAEYEKFLIVNLNDTIYEAQKKFNMAYVPSNLAQTEVKIWNDKESDSASFISIFNYVKYDKSSPRLHYHARMLMNPLKKPEIVRDLLRKHYYLAVPAKKIETWKEIIQRTDTLVTAVYGQKAADATDGGMDASKDSILIRQDTTYAVVADTIEKKRTIDNVFYIRTNQFKDTFTSFRIHAISIEGKEPEAEPIADEMRWWIALPDNWKKYFKEKFKYTEDYPEIFEIRKAQALRELDLSNQAVNDISFISNFKFLNTLNLSNTKVKDLSAIKDMKDLLELDISGTLVDTLHHLKGLSNLEMLNISKLQISSLDDIAGLTQMKELKCHENKLKDLSPLKNFTVLEELDISLNYEIKDVTPITGLVTLQKLILKKVTIESLEPLTGLVNLVYLDCFNAGIKDLTPLKKLPKLMHLELSHNALDGIEPLKSLNYIVHLGLSHTGVNNLNPISNYRHLQHLNVSGNRSLKDISPIPNETLLTFQCHYTGVSSGDVQKFKKKNPNCKITYY